jgi:hypothetical protein
MSNASKDIQSSGANPSYVIRELTEEEFKPLFEKHKNKAFENTHGYNSGGILSADELERMKELQERLGSPCRLHLGVFDDRGDFVGWSFGQQESATTFYMVNSAILPEHRRKGLYTCLLMRSLEILSAKGFQLIYSRHNVTNNAVIIPKLKAGFVISKIELDDRFGVLVHLHYYTNPHRRKIMYYRAGNLHPDEEIRQWFGI